MLRDDVQQSRNGILPRADRADATVGNSVRLLDVVALTVDLPDLGLSRGQVGTVVELLDGDAFEVEFSDDDGRTYATLALRPHQFLILHHRPTMVA